MGYDRRTNMCEECGGKLKHDQAVMMQRIERLEGIVAHLKGQLFLPSII